MKVSIVIAVYNEAPTVGELLQRVWAQPVPTTAGKEIIVVESNSTDGSRAIVAEFVARHADPLIRPVKADETAPHIHAIYEDRPQGKGHAIRKGLAAVTGDIVLIQDADLEYDVADYPDLLRPIIEGRAAVVLGSRHMGPNGWKIRKFAHGGPRAALMNIGGILFHALFNVLFGTRLSDPTTMYKVFRADCLRGLTLTCDRFDFDYELLGKLLRRGYQPLEVPVSYQSRGFDEGKKIRILRDPFNWITAIFACRFAPMPAHTAEPALPSPLPAPVRPPHKIAPTARSPRPMHRHGTS